MPQDVFEVLLNATVPYGWTRQDEKVGTVLLVTSRKGARLSREQARGLLGARTERFLHISLPTLAKATGKGYWLIISLKADRPKEEHPEPPAPSTDKGERWSLSDELIG